MDLTNQRIILTGAASGIGRAILDQLSRYPAQIIAADRDAAGLEAALKANQTGQARLASLVVDLSNADGVDRLFAFAETELGGVDIFIANAGFAYYEQLTHPDWAHIENIYRLNVFSPIYAAEKMRAQAGNRSYKTVITASAMGQMAIPGYALYGSTKAALHRFAEAYRYELGNPRQLMLVYPIGTRTNFFRAATNRTAAPQPWPTQTPEQVARAVLRGIQRDRKAVYPSPLFRLTLLADRWLPFIRRIEQAIEGRRFDRWRNG